jgi:hypothetical protein
MFSPQEYRQALTRRTFLTRSTTCLGGAALASLLNGKLSAAESAADLKSYGALPQLHFAPKAKRVIYLFQSGAPSHIDLFDPKPELTKRTGQELPSSVRGGQRITGMTSGQSQLLMVGPSNKFVRRGAAGVERSLTTSPSSAPCIPSR